MGAYRRLTVTISYKYTLQKLVLNVSYRLLLAMIGTKNIWNYYWRTDTNKCPKILQLHIYIYYFLNVWLMLSVFEFLFYDVSGIWFFFFCRFCYNLFFLLKFMFYLFILMYDMWLCTFESMTLFKFVSVSTDVRYLYICQKQFKGKTDGFLFK